MSVVFERIWREPAVFIGLLTTIVLLVVAILTGASWDASVILGILGPLLAALGIRPLVTPVSNAKK